MNERNPNEVELKKYCWDNIKEITLKGGFELYNALMLDIDRNEIGTIEEIQNRMKRK